MHFILVMATAFGGPTIEKSFVGIALTFGDRFFTFYLYVFLSPTSMPFSNKHNNNM